MQLARIHNHLRTELAPKSSAELLEATGVDIESSPDILLSLTGNASKVIKEKDGRWRWASKYYLRNFHDLLSLLARSRDGINERDLYDSYKDVRNDIKKLKACGGVYDVKSGSKQVLYPRDDRLELEISEDVKARYNSVRLPDSIEVHRYLVSMGLKDTQDATGVKIAQPVSRKRPSRQGNRRARKIKLTNTHLQNSGIDLSKDFTPGDGKDSAFN